MGGHSWQADMLRDTIEDLGMVLKTSSEYPNADVRYNKDTINQFIDSMDIIILPSRKAITSAKSVNRLAQAWSRGKPCIIVPLPAYLQYATDGEDVLVVRSEQDWVKHLKDLRDNPDKRVSMGQKGLKKAMEYLHPKDLPGHFFEAIEKADNILTSKEIMQNLFVQIIIPHYSNRTDYLELAALSALGVDGPQREVLVVSSAPENYEVHLSDELIGHKNFRFVYSPVRLNFSEANNLGLMNINPKATHIWLLNDDTIVSKQGMLRLLEAIGKRTDLMLNPYSNCDKGWLHNDHLFVGTKELVPAQSIEEMREFLDGLRNYEVPENREILTAPFCAMYATLMHRKVWEKIGDLNTHFKSGGEDLDFSHRAHRLGIETAWTKNGFVYHFGGRSRKFSEQTNYEQHHAEDQHNNSLVQKMWGRDGKKKRICIWSGPAFEKWDLYSYKRPLPIEFGGKPDGSPGIGGSETAAARLAMEFTKDGHHVMMVGDHPDCEQEGVELVFWNKFRPEEHFFDLFIASRNANCIDGRLRAWKTVLWLHDIFCLSHREPHNQFSELHLNKIDYFLALSPWHKQFILEYHKNIPEEKVLIVPNGICTELF